MYANVAKSTNQDHLPLRDFIINARGMRIVGVRCTYHYLGRSSFN